MLEAVLRPLLLAIPAADEMHVRRRIDPESIGVTVREGRVTGCAWSDLLVSVPGAAAHGCGVLGQ